MSEMNHCGQKSNKDWHYSNRLKQRMEPLLKNLPYAATLSSGAIATILSDPSGRGR
jgi:hypothetical protein